MPDTGLTVELTSKNKGKGRIDYLLAAFNNRQNHPSLMALALIMSLGYILHAEPSSLDYKIVGMHFLHLKDKFKRKYYKCVQKETFIPVTGYLPIIGLRVLRMPFCKQCGKEIQQDARFCPHCGADQTFYTATLFQAGVETKNSGLAAVLALILGFLGLWGVGHIYVGKIGRGLILLVLGIILTWGFGLFVFSGVILGASLGYRYGGYVGVAGVFFLGAIIWILIALSLFIWQIYDAYRLAKYYNEYVQKYRNAPWGIFSHLGST